MGKLQALRQISHHVYVTSLQLRELLGYFQEESARAECFVILFNRICDMHNAKLFRVRFESQDELERLRDRLGHTSSFPFMQPEQAIFKFDMAKRDQQLAANLIIFLATKEKFINLKDYSYINADGVAQEMPTGVPASWQQLSKMPVSGTFCVSYTCAPEDRKYEVRRQLMERYGGWSPPEDWAEVAWWTGLNELPPNVQKFVDFLASRFSEINEAFNVIKGGSNNAFTLRDFEKGIEKLKCRKFQGPGETVRITEVFRYLDPSGEGKVSRLEWTVLEQAWKEVRLSIREFVQFCDRTWPPMQGAGSNLEDCWTALDEDGSGTIDESEWRQILDRLGYFGPAMPIFRFLDKGEDGSISMEEFRTLEVFRDESDAL